MTRYIPALATTNYGEPHPFGLGTPHAIPQDLNWSDAFFSPRPPNLPHCLADKGYDYTKAIVSTPHFYMDAQGVFRDTMTDAPFALCEGGTTLSRRSIDG